MFEISNLKRNQLIARCAQLCACTVNLMLHLLQLSQLNKFGVYVVCLSNDEDGKQIHIGYGTVSQF